MPLLRVLWDGILGYHPEPIQNFFVFRFSLCLFDIYWYDGMLLAPVVTTGPSDRANVTENTKYKIVGTPKNGGDVGIACFSASDWLHLRV